jgi:hypothetical protein
MAKKDEKKDEGKYTESTAVARIRRCPAQVNVGAGVVEYMADAGVGIGTLGAISYLKKKHGYVVFARQPKH